MAVAFESKHSRTSEYRALPEHITVKSDLNGRHDLPDIEWLKKDILEHGQLQPVAVRNDGGKMVLVAGFSRWRAVSEINKGRKAEDKIQLRCTSVSLSETEAFMANIAENRFRNSTTELDDAHNIKRLLNNYGKTEEQVAAFYFPTAYDPELDEADPVVQQGMRDALKWIRSRIALVQLTPEAEKALKEGRLKLPAARAIAKLDAEQQKEAVKGAGKVKAKDIREASGKPKTRSLKEILREVIDTGKFPGIENRMVEAPPDLMEFLGRLVN